MNVNMAAFTAPKSDQLNADDLIAGPITITITGVKANEGSAEQPVSIYFEGDNNKPYKPCKSMRRVMVHVWGADAKNYIGRSMSLYCDPKVQFGGMAVGGIRIARMSHIDKPQTMALTATKAKRAPYTVQPMPIAQAVDVDGIVATYAAVKDQSGFDAAEIVRRNIWKQIAPAEQTRLKESSEAAKARISTTEEAK